MGKLIVIAVTITCIMIAYHLGKSDGLKEGHVSWQSCMMSTRMGMDEMCQHPEKCKELK